MKKNTDGTQDHKSITDADGTEISEGTTVNNGTPDVVGITDPDGTPDESTTVEEKKSLKDINPDELTDEQLNELDLSDFEVDETTDQGQNLGQEKKEIEKEGKKLEVENEASPESEEKTENEPEKIDPVKAAKAKLTKEEQKRSELEKENRELRQKLRDKDAGSFTELSDSELDQLKYDDPEAYKDYFLAEREHESSQKNVQADIETERMTLQFNEITEFAKVSGIDVEDQEKVKEFLTSDKFKQLDKFMLERLKPNGEGIYSNKDMKQAWDMLFINERLDAARSEGKTATIQETLANIERAGNGGSKQDRVKKTDSDKPKAASELDMADIDAMSETETDQRLRELEELEK